MKDKSKIKLKIRTESGIWAFTLVEMLVVIAVLSILIALTLPALGRAKKSGKRALCISNLSQIGSAFEMYFQDNSMRFPWNCTSYPSTETSRSPIKSALLQYCPKDELFRCPDDSEGLYEEDGISYLWNRYQIELPGNERADAKSYLDGFGGEVPSENFPIMSDGAPFHGKKGSSEAVNVLFLMRRVGGAGQLPFL